MAGVVVLVGGHGGREARYRAAVEETGRELVYCERRNPPPLRQVAAVLLCTALASHPQRKAAAELATAVGLPLLRMRSASVAALREALRSLDAGAAQPGMQG